MTISDITDKISEKYNENYGYVYDTALLYSVRLVKRHPEKYAFKNFQLMKDVESVLDRYYKLKMYKESGRYRDEV